jgi:very-short-patch-repair endonuclease
LRATRAGAGGSIEGVGDEECIQHGMRVERTSRGMAPRVGGAGSPGVDHKIGDLAERQHGVIGRWQLDLLGIERGKVQRRLERGLLRRLHQGAYAVGHRALTVEARWMAAVLSCGPGAVLSHRSAGQLWGIVPRAGIAPEVIRPRFFRRRPGILCHRSELPPDERGELLGIPVTSVVRTQFDLAGVLPKRGLERAMHEAEVKGLTDRLSLWDLLERYPRRRGARNLREVLGAKTPAEITQTDLEELFVEFLDEYGLPRPRLNATLPVRGRLLRPDCMWPEWRLLAELDGREAHHTDQAFESDRQRDRILLVEGWRSTRVTWRQLRDERAEIAADLRELLRVGPPPPTL